MTQPNQEFWTIIATNLVASGGAVIIIIRFVGWLLKREVTRMEVALNGTGKLAHTNEIAVIEFKAAIANASEKMALSAAVCIRENEKIAAHIHDLWQGVNGLQREFSRLTGQCEERHDKDD